MPTLKTCYRRLVCIATLFVCSPLVLTAGCNWLPHNQKLEQFREDNDRLLTDYRAVRDRAESLEVQNRALVDRVTALENRLSVISEAASGPNYLPASNAQKRPDSTTESSPAALIPPPPLPDQPVPDPWLPSAARE